MCDNDSVVARSDDEEDFFVALDVIVHSEEAVMFKLAVAVVNVSDDVGVAAELTFLMTLALQQKRFQKKKG